MKSTGFVLGALAVGVMMVAPAGLVVRSDKPAPAPEPTELYGNIDLTSARQVALTSYTGTGDDIKGYIRLFDWDDTADEYVHVWTGNAHGPCAIGDVDNDGGKELVGFNLEVKTEGKGSNKVVTRTTTLTIWEDTDHSDSPAYSKVMDLSSHPGEVEMGDVDGEPGNELIIFNGEIEVWKFTADESGYIIPSETTGPTATIDDNGHAIGSMGLEVGDSDNDGIDEMLVGGAKGADYPTTQDNRLAIVDYSESTCTYSVVAYIGGSAKTVIDSSTVADLDDGATPDDPHNEIFMSGPGAAVYIYRYDTSKGYAQIWSANFDKTVDGATANVFPYLQTNDAADINGDGDLEIVAGLTLAFSQGAKTTARYPRTYTWDYAGNGQWKEYHNSTTFGNSVDCTAHGDLDGDTDEEVVSGPFILDTTTDESGNYIFVNYQTLTYQGSWREVAVG